VSHPVDGASGLFKLKKIALCSDRIFRVRSLDLRSSMLIISLLRAIIRSLRILQLSHILSKVNKLGTK
jgi:hypothetical protein